MIWMYNIFFLLFRCR